MDALTRKQQRVAVYLTKPEIRLLIKALDVDVVGLDAKEEEAIQDIIWTFQQKVKS
jgi:hypothetical protein